MKWRKLGKIFDPSEHKLPLGCFGFAQSPQTLVFDDFVRIYFSTRRKEDDGMFISHIAFVDMDKQFSKVLRISTDYVVPPATLGSFDEHGIFPINPLRHNNKILAYTCGWSRRISVAVETGTGLVTSDDQGVTFKRSGDGPIMGPSLHEPFLVGDSFVKVYNDVFHMWYIYGQRWLDPTPNEPAARVYKIAHATSADGISWIREGRDIIADKLNTDECQALPTVLYFRDTYHMYFCYREATGFRTNSERGYRLGYAWSTDLVNWTRNDIEGGIDTTPGAWDSDMMCYPHIFSVDDKVYLLYNGNEFGRHGFGLAALE
jgi:hypothetical protein